MTVEHAAVEEVLASLRLQPSALARDAADVIELLLAELDQGVVEWGVMSRSGAITQPLARAEAERLARRTPDSTIVRSTVHRSVWLPSGADEAALEVSAQPA